MKDKKKKGMSDINHPSLFLDFVLVFFCVFCVTFAYSASGIGIGIGIGVTPPSPYPVNPSGKPAIFAAAIAARFVA
jgi:hypothetical protein